MANTNFTVSPAPATVDAFPKALLCMPELEKISCSVRGQSRLHPLHLMGKKIRLAELILSEVGFFEGDAYESSISVATVLAVRLGSIEHGIESSLLLQDDDGSDPYHVDLASLTILEVLSS